MRLIRKAALLFGASRRRGRQRSGSVMVKADQLFDPEWYLAQYPDVANADISPYEHYVRTGWREGRAPHPMINVRWLAQTNPDSADRNPLEWYVEQGERSGAVLTLAFTRDVYKKANPDLADVDNLFAHFMERGWREGRRTTAAFDFAAYRHLDPAAPSEPTKAVTAWAQSGFPQLDARLLEEAAAEPPSWTAGTINSYAFDPDWYTARNPEVVASKLDPLTHYLEHGSKAGRSPHPMINPVWIKERYPEVGGSELLEWIFGCGAPTVIFCPIFDEETYRRNNPDLATIENPVEHFMAGGWREHRVSHPVFREAHYLMANPDVAAAGVRATEHFVQSGVMEGRAMSPLFWPDWYADQIGLPKGDQIALLEHYLGQGFAENLEPNPLMDQAWYDRSLSPRTRDGVSALVHLLADKSDAKASPHPLFDFARYGAALEGALDGVDRYAHFLADGDRQGRTAHPLFDAEYYMRANPDQAFSEFGPTLHYVLIGAPEMRWPNPLFDPEHFAWNSAAPETARQQGLLHYIRHPEDARHPHPLFDATAYAAQVDGNMGGLEPLAHYLNTSANLDARLVINGRTGVFAPKPSPLLVDVSEDGPDDVGLVSVLIPLFNSPAEHLRRVIDSIRLQTHQAFELILVDDGSSASDGREIAREYAAKDDRIRVEILPNNVGISTATNHALTLAQGEFVAFVDHDDVLHPAALERTLTKLAAEKADACYTNQCYVDAAGRFQSTFFKPAFSPTLLLGVMYIGHLLVVRTEVARELSGFDPRFDRLQDYEFMLRLAEKSHHIAHVDEILYQWRMIPGSIAADANSKGSIEPLQAEAVNLHLARKNLPIRARPHGVLPHRLILEPAFDDSPRHSAVEFIVREAGAVTIDMIAQCRLQAPNAKVTVVGSADSDHGLVSDVAAVLERTLAEVLVFVDPRIETFTTSKWLDHLLMHLVDATVFAAAPHITDHSGRIISAGSVLTRDGLAPAMRGLAGHEDGHAGALVCDREASGLNGLVVAFKVDAARGLGGFDQTFAGMLYALGDLSLRAASAGLRNIAVSGARAVTRRHAELLEGEDEIDALIFRDARRQILDGGDPYFSAGFAGDTTFRADY
ncbi:hypothetical protein BH10PSE2_BH10PSE2_07730 [soil metagenome]